LLQAIKHFFLPRKNTAAVIATGWLGDTIACTAAAGSLSEQGYEVTLFTRWPQLIPILKKDKRFKVQLYWHLKLIKFARFLFPFLYEKVVWEPSQWSYQEPFTSEIRRLAGCDPLPSYRLLLPEYLPDLPVGNEPVITISRDLYKRAFGRDVDQLIQMLSKIGRIEWVGLSAEKNSKHGKSSNLLVDAQKIAQSTVFVGPEGGLLWLAAGVGARCIYFTENIMEVAKRHQCDSLDHVLGSKNYFPDDPHHLALPPFCTNDYVFVVIAELANKLMPR
jgi:hypothetical protein